MENKAKFSIKLDEHLLLEIKNKALLEGCNPSELIRSAITEYLTRDINIHSQELGAIESLRSDIKSIDKKLDLFSSLWIYWLRFYFCYVPQFKPQSQEAEDTFFAKGEKMKEDMLSNFKKSFKNSPRLIEILLADYLVKEVDKQ